MQWRISVELRLGTLKSTQNLEIDKFIFQIYVQRTVNWTLKHFTFSR